MTNFLPKSYFKTDTVINSDLKPIIIFQGELFESDFNYDRLKKFFMDFFQLYDKESISISEMRRIIAISIENEENGIGKVNKITYNSDYIISSKDNYNINNYSNIGKNEKNKKLSNKRKFKFKSKFIKNKFSRNRAFF